MVFRTMHCLRHLDLAGCDSINGKLDDLGHLRQLEFLGLGATFPHNPPEYNIRGQRMVSNMQNKKSTEPMQITGNYISELTVFPVVPVTFDYVAQAILIHLRN